MLRPAAGAARWAPAAWAAWASQAPCDAGACDLHVADCALSVSTRPIRKGANFRRIHTIIHKYTLPEAKAHLKWVVK